MRSNAMLKDVKIIYDEYRKKETTKKKSNNRIAKHIESPLYNNEYIGIYKNIKNDEYKIEGNKKNGNLK